MQPQTVATPPATESRRWTADALARRAEWHRYYSPKRVPHQLQQLEMLRHTEARRVLEIGPYLGLVTAMLANAGYLPETLDLVDQAFESPTVPHHRVDLLELKPEAIAGFDAILCCETLEHLPWPRVGHVLATLAQSGARNLIVSVPYMGWQLHAQLYLNPWTWNSLAFIKGGNGRRRFIPEADPLGHKWEVGYRGHSVAAWEQTIEQHGWRIIRRTFSSPCRSIFHLLENAR